MNTYTENLLNKANEIHANIEIDPTSGVITLFNDVLTDFYGVLSNTSMIKLIAAIKKARPEGFTVKCTDGCYILTKKEYDD